MERAQWIAAATALLLAVAGGVWFGRAGPVPELPPPPTDLAAPAAAAATVTIHVSGAVRRPGLVEVPAGARVADAIAAAGGLVLDADPGGLNLAAPVTDGQQVTVPVAGAGAVPAGVAGDGRVRVNLAGAAELESLPGVGPVLAERIAAYRDEHGPFTAVEDLLDVPGIGEAKLAAMRDAVAIP